MSRYAVIPAPAPAPGYYYNQDTITAESLKRADALIRALGQRYLALPPRPQAGTLANITSAQRRALAACCYYDVRPAATDIEYRPRVSGGRDQIVVMAHAFGRDCRVDIYPDGRVEVQS